MENQQQKQQLIDNNNNRNDELFFSIFRNKFIRSNIFNQVQKFNESLKYIRYNYYDFPLESIIKTNNKSLLINKLKEFKNNQNSILLELKFSKKWFNLLFEKKWFNLEIMELINSLFKNEIFNYLLTLRSTQLDELSKLSKLLIENNNIEILEYIDSIILKNQFKFSLIGLEKIQSEYNIINQYSINYISAFKYQPGIDNIYSTLKNNMIPILKEIIEIKTLKYLNQQLPRNTTTTIPTTIDTLIIDNLNLLFEKLPYNSNIHFQFIKELLNTQIINNEIIKKLILLAIKFNDENIFKLLFNSNSKLIKTSTNNNKGLIDFEIKDLKSIPFGNIIENYQLLEGDLFNVFYGSSPGINEETNNNSIRFKILKSGLLNFKRDNKQIYRYIDDPNVADYILSNDKLFNFKLNLQFSTNCIRNDLSNIELFEKNNVYVNPSLNGKKDLEPSLEKLNYLIDNYDYNKLLFNRNFIIFNKTTDNNLEILDKLIKKLVNIHLTIQDLLECSKIGLNNLVDKILDDNLITRLQNSSKSHFYNDALFQSLKDSNFNLFKKISNYLKRENLISSSHIIFFNKISKYPIPLEIENRIIHLNCLNHYFKLENKLNNLLDLNYFLIYNYNNFINSHKKVYKKYTKEYLLLYLNNNNNDNNDDLFQNLNIKKLSKLLSNNQILIDKFFSTILNQLLNFLKYFILIKNKKSFIYLFNLIYNYQGDEEFSGSNEIIKILPTIFNYIAQYNNIAILNFLLSQSNLFNNHYLNDCHLLIIINHIKYQNSIILSYLINNNYKYTPSTNNSTDNDSSSTRELINELSKMMENQKIINIKNLIKFLKNVGLSNLVPTIQYHYIGDRMIDDIDRISFNKNLVFNKLNK